MCLAESHNIGQQNTLFSTWMSVDIRAHYFFPCWCHFFTLVTLREKEKLFDAFVSFSDHIHYSMLIQCLQVYSPFRFSTFFSVFFAHQTNRFACNTPYIHAEREQAIGLIDDTVTLFTEIPLKCMEYHCTLAIFIGGNWIVHWIYVRPSQNNGNETGPTVWNGTLKFVHICICICKFLIVAVFFVILRLQHEKSQKLFIFIIIFDHRFLYHQTVLLNWTFFR